MVGATTLLTFLRKATDSMRSSRVTTRMCLAGALTAGMAAGGSALAQQQVALDRFDPAPAGDRMFGVESPYAAGEGLPQVSLITDYAHNPYVLHHGPGFSDVGQVVSTQAILHFNVSLSIFNRVNLNFSVPAAVIQDGGDPTNSSGATVASPHDAAFGDVRLGARVRIFGEYDDPFQLGVSGFLWVPSGAANAYMSDGSVRGATTLIFGGHFPILNWSFTTGFQFRPTQAIDAATQEGTNMQFGAGVGFLLADGRVQVGPEVKGSFVVAKPDHHTTDSEVLLDARYRLVDDFELGVGIGPGLSSGFGTPDVRVIGMLAFSPQITKPPPPDRDGDGVPDAADACPDIAAPRDPIPAKPGCPAVSDRDGDRIPDDVDACPDVAGVASSDPSRNGCPPDRDGDRIPDAKDACPDQPGPPSADPTRNGCPAPRDMDGDGIPDSEDACPTIPGIRSSDPKQNGCPGDRDGDGIRDDLDACPDVKGVPSKDPKKNGCPRAQVKDGEISILEQVEFETGSAKIKPASDALLEEIAGIFKKFADITKVEVQGHTDNQGNKGTNKTLSQQRAESVKKALVARGIDQKRLFAKGFGSDVPIAGNETEEGRAKNRRVQFVILERASEQKSAPRPAPPPSPAEGRRAQASPAPEEEVSSGVSTSFRSDTGANAVIRLSLSTTLGLVAASLLFAGVASAQPAPVVNAVAPPPPPPAPAVAGTAVAISGVTPVYVDKANFTKDSRPEGWGTRASVGATGAFANNGGVVGQADGSSFSLGLKGDAGLDYNHEKHEWRTTLGVAASVTRTPVIDQFVKTSDNLNLDTIYLFHAVPWFGPFALGSFNTSMFAGADVEAAPVSYVITNADGTKQAPIANTHLSLSDPFRPLTFKESAGVFVQPYQSVPATIELRVGAGAQEVLADGQLAVTATSGLGTPTAEVDLKQLSNANQLGPEVAASVWGVILGKAITYKVNFDAMTPAAHSALAAGDTRGPFALTNVQVDGKVSFHFVEWASLDYQLRAIRQPQVVDNFQIQNTLLLTFGLSYNSRTPPPPPAGVRARRPWWSPRPPPSGAPASSAPAVPPPAPPAPPPPPPPPPACLLLRPVS